MYVHMMSGATSKYRGTSHAAKIEGHPGNVVPATVDPGVLVAAGAGLTPTAVGHTTARLTSACESSLDTSSRVRANIQAFAVGARPDPPQAGRGTS